MAPTVRLVLGLVKDGGGMKKADLTAGHPREGSASDIVNWEGYYPGRADIMIIAQLGQKLNTLKKKRKKEKLL